jgi:hypothetical protein
MKEERSELVEVEAAVAACNAVAIAEPIKVALVATLKPIAERMENYKQNALMPVISQKDADAAATVCAAIAADIATVKGDEVLSKITDGLHKLHRRFTGLRDMFVTPLESNRKTIKGSIIAWQQTEADKAAKEQARLQAIADEKARKEREALEARAAKLKTPEKKEEALAAAAAVIAPTIQVTAAKTNIKTASVWKVTSLDAAAFVAGCAANPALLGFIEISQTKLERSKASNNMFEAPGVVFDKITR